MKLIFFQTLVQFSPPTLYVCQFSPFNKILLSLFYVWNEFYNIFLVNIEIEICQTVLTTQMLSRKTFENVK